MSHPTGERAGAVARSLTWLGAIAVILLLPSCSSEPDPAQPEPALSRLTHKLLERGLPEACFSPVIGALNTTDVEALLHLLEGDGSGTLTLEPAATNAIIEIGRCGRSDGLFAP